MLCVVDPVRPERAALIVERWALLCRPTTAFALVRRAHTRRVREMPAAAAFGSFHGRDLFRPVARDCPRHCRRRKTPPAFGPPRGRPDLANRLYRHYVMR